MAAGTKIGSAFITVDADTKGFDSATKGFVSRTLSALGPLAAGFAAVLGGKALFNAGKALQAAGEEAATNAARIDQVAESMGRTAVEASGLTTRLTDLSEETASLTGVDDDLIQQGQAVLLTFAEVGKDADTVGGVFDRATQAAVDLAATGFGSVDSNAVQLGKALQDPIKGIAALGRSGVTFTAAQKEMIASMVEVGDLAGAQKLVLEAVESQVGGVAAATAKTSDKVRVSWDNVVQDIGQKLLPIFDRLGTFLIDTVFPKIEKFAIGAATVITDMVDAFSDADSIGEGILDAFKVLSGGKGVGDIFKSILGVVQNAFTGIVDWLTSGGITMIVNGILEARQRLLDAALRVFPVLIDAIVQIIPKVVEALVAAVPLIIDGAVTLLTSIVEAIPILLPQLLEGIVALVTQIADALVTLVPLLVEGAITLFLALVQALAEALPVILNALVDAILALVALLPTLIPTLVDAAVTLFLALVTGILDILPDLIDALLGDVLPALIDAMIDSAPKIVTAAIRLFMGLVEALVKVVPALILTLVTKVIPKLMDSLVKAIPAMVEAGKNLILGLGRGILSAAAGVVKSVKDAVVNKIKDLWPFSPAKAGPFRQFPPEMAGSNLANLWAEGIASGGANAIAAAASVTSQINRSLGGQTLAVAGGGGGRGTVININMEGSGIPEVDAQRLSAAAAVVRRMENL